MELSHKHANLKISKGIRILTKLRNYLSKKIQPHLDYRLLVWGNATPTNLKPTKKNLQKAIRKILFKNRNHSLEPLFKELKILDFEKHRFLKLAVSCGN